MKRLLCLAFVLTIASWNAGCTPQNTKAPPLVKVGGTVTLDGKDMADGEVRFAIPGQPGKVIPIKSGKFSGEAFEGKNQIEVVLEKDGAPVTTDKKEPMKINSIDAKYWGPSSTLNTEITAAKEDFKFEVTSAPAPK